MVSSYRAGVDNYPTVHPPHPDSIIPIDFNAYSRVDTNTLARKIEDMGIQDVTSNKKKGAISISEPHLAMRPKKEATEARLGLILIQEGPEPHTSLNICQGSLNFQRLINQPINTD